MTQEQVDLTNCDKEPIHIPGSVQSFGCLIAFGKDRKITRVSENFSKFCGYSVEKVKSKKIDDIFTRDVLEDLEKTKERWHYVEIKSVDGHDLQLMMGEDGDEKFIDIMPTTERKYSKPVAIMRDFGEKMSKVSTIKGLGDVLAATVRELTGFDRVKIYQFDKDWNGEIICEERVSEVPSYLGLHFPHTDIPKQARELYQRNKVRVIGDVEDPQAKLVSFGIEEPLDMSYSFVRSVSDIHLQYLRNMDVRASMSLSLFCNGKFWGLVACHHRTSLTFSVEEAALYEAISNIASARLTELTSLQHARKETDCLSLIQSIARNLSLSKSSAELVNGQPNAGNIVLSTGTVFYNNGEILKRGVVPKNSVIEELVDWLEEREQDVSSYVDLPSHFSADVKFIACGLLAAKVKNRPRTWLLWFRVESVREVHWAGDPFKPVSETTFGERLYPRTSFEIWKEIRRGYSEDWDELDIRFAGELAEWLAVILPVTAS